MDLAIKVFELISSSPISSKRNQDAAATHNGNHEGSSEDKTLEVCETRWRLEKRVKNSSRSDDIADSSITNDSGVNSSSSS